MTEYTGSAGRKLDRVIAAQRYDARTFTGGRIFRVVVSKKTPAGFSHKQLFIASLTGLDAAEALAATGLENAIPVSHDPFPAPPPSGPALIGERRIPVTGEQDARSYLKTTLVKRLLMPGILSTDATPTAGPFSEATQLAAAGLIERPGTRLFGARVMRVAPDQIREEIFVAMASDREDVAAMLRVEAADSASVTVEVEDTLFDRPYDGNTQLILEHRTRTSPDEYLEQQRLARLPLLS